MTLRSEPYEHLVATTTSSTRSRRFERDGGRARRRHGRRSRSAWLLRHPLVNPIVVGPRRPDAPRAGPRGARARARPTTEHAELSGAVRPRRSELGRMSRPRARAATTSHRAADARRASRRWTRCCASSRAASSTCRCAPSCAPPKSPGLMGLMTGAPRRRRAAVRAQGRRDLPREPASAGSTPTRASSLAVRRRDRRADRGCVDASAADRDPHGGRHRRRDARARARRRERRSRCSAPASQARAHIEAHGRACCRSSACASTAARPSTRRRSPPSAAERYGLDVERRRLGRGRAARRRRRRDRRRPRASRSSSARWLAPGTHVNAVGSSIPTTRELDGAAMAARAPLRRRARVDAQRVGRLSCSPLREGAIAEAHRARRARRGAERQRAGPHERRTSSRCFKSLGLAVEDLAAAELALRVADAAGLGAEVPL